MGMGAPQTQLLGNHLVQLVAPQRHAPSLDIDSSADEGF